MNLLQKWEAEHKKRILQELKQSNIKLTLENIPKIIHETSFKIRSKKYPDACPYYQSEHSCHPEIKDLNCFLCACPQYDSSKLEGGCKINSKKGKYHKHQNLPKGKIWDCSDCNTYHTPISVKKYLEKKFKKPTQQQSQK